METIKKNYKLTEETCDETAELVTDFCNKTGADSKDVLRYRLSVEECLLHWMDNGLRGTSFELQMGKLLREPYIQLEIGGAALNPYSEDDENYGRYAKSVLVGLGLDPEYSYTNGRNRVIYRVKKKPLGQLAQLCLVIAAAAAIGFAGMYVFPESVRAGMLTSVIEPLYNTFFNILGCIAGPMIFLSVAWGVYGVGDAATFGRIGKSMMLRFVGLVMLASACSAVFFPVLGPPLSRDTVAEGQFASVSELILGIFPSTIVEPFESGNTLQIILLGIVIGIALLYLGRQTSSVARAIEQVNILVQFLMEIISRLVPFVIFLIIINMIWSGSLSVMTTVWKLLLALAAAFAAAAVLFTMYTAARRKVNPILLVKKSIPTVIIAFTTASSAAAFGSNVTTCEKQFGIDQSLIRFGIPLGMVMHKPIAAIYNTLLMFFFADRFGVSCSAEWICVAVFISAIVAIATPPIPGGGAIAYSVLFSQMGIPGEALAIALAMDLIMDFVITAHEMYVLPLAMINISSGLGLIDADTLRSAPSRDTDRQ